MKKEDEPKIDESLLTEGQKKELEKRLFNWKWAVFWAVIVTLMIVAIIVIVLL